MVNRVNRSQLMLVSLGAVGLLAAMYGKLTVAAPASEPASTPTAVAQRPSLPTTSTPPVAASAAPAPSSPETARLDARRQLYESVEALVQASEFETARKLLDEDQQRYGDDLAPQWHDLEQSYRLIADCLERPSAKLRARAEAFLQVSEAASLKPRISAACSGRR
jgi:hypothetical protein